ncbi:MAG: zinc-ribbon domain-containing protein, partial [Clostridia bacterium]
PYCAGQLPIVGENDLLTVNPTLAKEWHPTKNGDLAPYDVTAGSHRKVWWLCEEGHEWQSIIKSRNKGVGCPYCSNKRVVPGKNDLFTINPELAKEWHPTKNGELTPQQFTFGSGKKVWWICKNGHEFYKSIDARRKNPNCPICSSRRRTSFPEQAIYYYVKQVFPDAINSYKDIFANNSRMELDIYIPSIKVGIEYDGKAFHSETANILRDAKKYTICKENGIILVRITDNLKYNPIIKYDHKIEIPDQSSKHLNYAISLLLYKLERLEVVVDVDKDRKDILSYLTATDKSLASEFPEVAEEWDYEKNGKLLPQMIHPGSNERVWWKCKDCGESWKTSVAERTKRDKTGCPRCSVFRGAKKHHETILRKKGSVVETHSWILDSWDYEKNNVSPYDVISGSGRKIWLKCDKCGYTWEATVNHITKRGINCPCCINKVVVPGVNDLATTHPQLLEDWDYENNILLPTQTVAGTSKKIFWKCHKCGHMWQASGATRVKGTGCIKCYRERRHMTKSK